MGTSLCFSNNFNVSNIVLFQTEKKLGYTDFADLAYSLTNFSRRFIDDIYKDLGSENKGRYLIEIVFKENLITVICQAYRAGSVSKKVVIGEKDYSKGYLGSILSVYSRLQYKGLNVENLTISYYVDGQSCQPNNNFTTLESIKYS